MGKLVDRTYGSAFFELCLEAGKVDEYTAEICQVKKVLEAETEFMELLNHPNIGGEAKEKMLKECFEGKLSEPVFRFLLVILRARRQDMIMEIFDDFMERVRVNKRIGQAWVTSAVALTDAQKKTIEKRLLETTDNVSYEMSYDVDERLIGGMRIRVDNIVVDGSVKYELHAMTRELEKIRLV